MRRKQYLVRESHDYQSSRSGHIIALTIIRTGDGNRVLIKAFFLMSAKEGLFGIPPRRDLCVAATHPFSQMKTAGQFAVIQERLADAAAAFRPTAPDNVQPDDQPSNATNKLETTEEKST
ncbi:MAG: hypothetical protein KGJ53_13635 [Alphaproteobacteria bacterium]|nr:hypothetical protein [Alphaproteobacteria bacterium]MDE2164200.1 hypothetical protein [Alphaproteobacteria bacterium]